jgi:predicted nucleic acid-binding protein
MLIETDVLLAALNNIDPLNEPALRVLNSGPFLSPFTVFEINMLYRAEKLEIKDYDLFAKDLESLLSTSSVQVLPDRARYHSVARHLETRFKLSFFDSLHGAVSKVEGEMIASFDRTYDKLSSEGIKRIDPRIQ